MQGAASADLAVADLVMHDMTVMEPNQGTLAQTVTLTVLEGAPLTRSIADFRSMPFMEFATIHAVSTQWHWLYCQSIIEVAGTVTVAACAGIFCMHTIMAQPHVLMRICLKNMSGPTIYM